MDVVEALRDVLPASVVRDDPDVLAAHRHDECRLAEAGDAAVVVRARSAEDVVACLRVAHRLGVPVVPRGAGSGLAGAANALDGAIVLSLAGMAAAPVVDPVGRTARVEPGVLNADLDRAAAEHGLWYPPDPGSREYSTIGGNIATNAGGMCCARFGVTADHVAALRVVLADGTTVTSGSTSRKDVAGLDLTRLLVGSEGTLGVVVEATVRLLPRPDRTAVVVAWFDATAEAVQAVGALTSTCEPTAVELMDRTTVAAVESWQPMGLDTDAAALLVVRLDGTSADPAAAVRSLGSHGGRDVAHTDDPAEVEAFMQARRLALPALEALGDVLLDDVAVPVPALPRLLAGIEAVARRESVTIGTFGHAADANLHPTIVVDPGDPQGRERARRAFDAVVEVALDLGGTVSGEHGVGALKTSHLSRQLGEAELALMRRVKQAFDPSGILNPGRAF